MALRAPCAESVQCTLVHCIAYAIMKLFPLVISFFSRRAVCPSKFPFRFFFSINVSTIIMFNEKWQVYQWAKVNSKNAHYYLKFWINIKMMLLLLLSRELVRSPINKIMVNIKCGQCNMQIRCPFELSTTIRCCYIHTVHYHGRCGIMYFLNIIMIIIFSFFQCSFWLFALNILHIICV